MKKLVGLLGIVVSAFSPSAFAATGSVSANVSTTTVPISATANYRIDVVNYDTIAGSCLKPPVAVQIFMLPAGSQGDKMRQLVLAAQLAGKKILVGWDDTKKDAAGYCIAQSIGVVT